MPASVEYKATPTFRELNGRFTRGNKELLENRRDLVRRQGRRMKDFLKTEAPKRTGKFASNIRFRTFVEQQAVGFRIYMPEPLATFIQKGTRAHTITPRNAKVLRFVVGGGGLALPFGGAHASNVVFATRVRHPGTRPNRFIGRASRRWLPGARADLRRVGTRYIRTVQGKSSGARSL